MNQISEKIEKYLASMNEAVEGTPITADHVAVLLAHTKQPNYVNLNHAKEVKKWAPAAKFIKSEEHLRNYLQNRKWQLKSQDPNAFKNLYSDLMKV